MAGKKKMRIASPGRRFLAAMIDKISGWLILCWAIVKLSYLVYSPVVIGGGSYSYSDSYVHGSGFVTSMVATLVLVVLCVGYVGVQLYLYTKSQSIGKAAMGLMVVDNKKGNGIGFGKMLLREVIVKKASAVVMYLGYIWILIDDFQCAWHDKILDTYVVDIRFSEYMNTIDEQAACCE